jgi:hypothetical protein
MSNHFLCQSQEMIAVARFRPLRILAQRVTSYEFFALTVFGWQFTKIADLIGFN